MAEDGFLGRWSRRKEAVREGRELPPEAATTPATAPTTAPAAVAPAGLSTPGSELAVPPPADPEPLPTLEQALQLTPDSDFKPFMRAGVDPQVRNAAMKKLFSDPHFNVMDGLDTYIDDYSKPDPLPLAMARQLASARFLNLFEETEEEKKARAEGREVADGPPQATVAQSVTAVSDPAVSPPAAPHADPDLRLQQDDAPGPEGPGAGDR